MQHSPSENSKSTCIVSSYFSNYIFGYFKIFIIKHLNHVR
jgi:hypothetical protein